MSVDRAGPLSGLLAKWSAGAKPEVYATTLERCGGAYLYLTRKQVYGMIGKGTRFAEDPDRVIPEEGRGHIRVKCGAELMARAVTEELPNDGQGEPKKYTRMVRYGLCVRCGGWEMGIRKRMADEQKKAEADARAPGGRRRGFREAAE